MMPDSPVFWFLAISGVLLTGISKSGFAGGAGVVAVPLLALVIPVTQAVALILPLLILMDLRTIFLSRKCIDRTLMMTLLPAAFVGIVIGGFMMGYMSGALLLMLLGAVSLLFAAWQKLAPRLIRMRGAAWFWGAFSGLSSTLLHAGGPPVNIYLLGKQLPKDVWIATAAVFFGVMNLIKLVPYSLVGAWQELPWIVIGLLAPIAYLGVGMGHRLQGVMSETVFTSCCRWLLAITGLMLLIKSMLIIFL
jgi:uncharacterized membrane protein YfcA